MSGVNWTEAELAARTLRILDHDPTPLIQKISKQIRDGEFLPQSLRTHNLTPRQKATGRIRQPRGMNKTEARYAQHLELQKTAGAIAWYRFEGVTLKLAFDDRLTFDFAVMAANGALELHDVKACRNGRTPHIEEDAKEKMKNAAENFPFRVLVVWPGQRGEWESREF